jgi:hypothetical protein
MDKKGTYITLTLIAIHRVLCVAIYSNLPPINNEHETVLSPEKTNYCHGTRTDFNKKEIHREEN